MLFSCKRKRNDKLTTTIKNLFSHFFCKKKKRNGKQRCTDNTKPLESPPLNTQLHQIRSGQLHPSQWKVNVSKCPKNSFLAAARYRLLVKYPEVISVILARITGWNRSWRQVGEVEKETGRNAIQGEKNLIAFCSEIKSTSVKSYLNNSSVHKS